MLDNWTREEKLEICFITFFSALVFGLFYTLISMNGLILGNDPAVHLSKAQDLNKTGRISLDAEGWLPPLFDIFLAAAISFSGANNIGQLILIEKVTAVTIDWLLFLSVYLVGSRLFNKKIGALAAVFLIFCYPIYELNTWGGYTTALGMAFLVLLFSYSYLATKQIGYVAVDFFISFAIVLSHQLTAFLAVIVMSPVLLFMLTKFKGTYLKGFIAIIAGGAIAFFTFYSLPIVSYLDAAIYHLFFSVKAYVLQIPYASYQSFLLYFGFIQFIAIGGIGISYYLLKQQKKLILFATLLLSLLVPLFFAESFVLGLLLPFEWFTYYLMPSIVIFAAVCVVFSAERLRTFYAKNKPNQRKKWLMIVGVSLIGLIGIPMFAFQVNTAYNEIVGDAAFNSKIDMNAYDAAIWINQKYPTAETIVSTMSPGDWLKVFTGKHVISQTFDWEGTNPIAESVLNLVYEIESPQTFVKAFETNGNTSDENYVSMNQIWSRVSYSSIDEESVIFCKNGASHSFTLANMSKTVSLDDQSIPGKIVFRYFNSQLELMETIAATSDGYPIDISWTVSALDCDISNVKLCLTTYLDTRFSFDKAQIPRLMNWTNPWDVPSRIPEDKEKWATVTFSNSDLVDHYVGLYDQQNKTAFGFYFEDLPITGNLSALPNRQIDAVRYTYDFELVSTNQTATRRYQILTLTKNSYPTLQAVDDLQSLFKLRVGQLPIIIHNYKDYIAKNNIEFIIYDKNQFDSNTGLQFGASFLPQLTKCQFLELVYSNDRYDVFRVLSNFNQTQVW